MICNLHLLLLSLFFFFASFPGKGVDVDKCIFQNIKQYVPRLRR
jgi:hypothetical protein